MKGAKKDNKKLELLNEDDGTGMPKSIVTFKWEFEIQQTNLTNLAIMFEWISSASLPERLDTGLVEVWNPKSQDKLNILCYERTFDPMRIDEVTAKLLSTRKLFVYIVNIDDMKVKWETLLDVGCLLTDKREQPDFLYLNTKLPILEIEILQIRISADKQLLQQKFKEYLNPLQIQIIGVKGLTKQEKHFENVYVSYEFFDGTKTTTVSLPHDTNLRWNAKHVHLLGSHDQSSLKEKLATSLMNVQVHDCDELLDTSLKKQQDILDIDAWLKVEAEKEKPLEVEVIDPKKKGAKDQKKEAVVAKKEPAKKENKNKKDVKFGEPIKELESQKQYNRNNFGVASYLLTDLLKSNVRNFKLQSPVVPRKRFEDLESANLDLNTTAKQNLPKLQLSTNYMDNNCFLLIEFDIAIGIGMFKQPIIVQPQIAQLDKDKKGVKPQVQAPTIQPTILNQQSEHNLIIQGLPAIFGRAVYIMPYKSVEFIQKFQKVFYDINLSCFPSSEGGLRALTTKALNENEKHSRELDYLGGFEILDAEFRVFCIEGLSDGGMKQFTDALPRDIPNTETFKILSNPDIRFNERMYTEFNVEIKRIRLRDNLVKLLTKPDLYLRTKVPENIQDTLVRISNILKQWNLRTLSQFNLFPKSCDLIAVERKYSDSLTDEDITGVEQQPSKNRKQQFTDHTNADSKSNNHSPQILIQIKDKTPEILIQTNDQQNKVEIHLQNTKTLKQTVSSHKDDHETYNLQMKTYRLDMASAGTYSGQTNNGYEQQVKALRDRIRKDPNNFYTYSRDYLSLSIDPYNIDEERINDIKKSDELTLQRQKFRSVVPRSQDEVNIHPKRPPQSVLDELKQDKYFEQQKLRENMAKPTKQLKVFQNGKKEEFKQHIGKINVFSSPLVKQEEMISSIQKEQEMIGQRKKEYQDFKNKCLGATYFNIKSRAFEKSDQIDKNKGILEDKSVKKGLMLTNTQIKNSNIQLTRRVEQPPSSIFHKIPFKEQEDIFARKLDLTKATSQQMFDVYQEPEILTKSIVHKPLRQIPY